MPRRISMEFDFGFDNLLSFRRVLNFDDLAPPWHRTMKDVLRAGEINKTTGRPVHVKIVRRLRRALAKIEKLIADHGFMRLRLAWGCSWPQDRRHCAQDALA